MRLRLTSRLVNAGCGAGEIESVRRAPAIVVMLSLVTHCVWYGLLSERREDCTNNAGRAVHHELVDRHQQLQHFRSRDVTRPLVRFR